MHAEPAKATGWPRLRQFGAKPRSGQCLLTRTVTEFGFDRFGGAQRAHA
jgi:hypothetical protein